MTSKERARFRAMANSLEPEFHIGKGGLSEGVINQTLDSFNTKELIKIKVHLESAEDTPRHYADMLSEATSSQVIQVIGGVIVLYKENPDLDKKQEKKKPAKKSKPLSNVKAKRALAEKKEAEKKKAKRDFYAKKRDKNF